MLSRPSIVDIAKLSWTSCVTEPVAMVIGELADGRAAILYETSSGELTGVRTVAPKDREVVLRAWRNDAAKRSIPIKEIHAIDSDRPYGC